MKKSFFYTALLLLGITALIINGCVKQPPDPPPVSNIPFNPDKVLTIQEIKQIYVDSAGAYTFTDTVSFFAVVTADESSGNLYKTVYVQDNTGAIQMNLLNPGGLYVGDSIRVLLLGATIDQYHDLNQINNIKVISNVLKLKTGVIIKPDTVTISDLQSNYLLYESKLIFLDNVQFSADFLGQTFADAEGLQSKSVTLEDCEEKTVTVRTSGYANFADSLLPEGKGSMIAIASVYNGESQLVIRDYNELKMNNPRCNNDYIFKDGFANLSKWNIISVEGAQMWHTDNYGNPAPCAVMTGYDGSHHNKNDDWLITPSFDLSSFSSVILTFETATKYSGNTLEIKISVDYDGGPDPSTATWTDLNATLSTGNFTWTPSGDVDLSDYLGENVHIAFRYTSTSTKGATWEVDNVAIKGTN